MLYYLAHRFHLGHEVDGLRWEQDDAKRHLAAMHDTGRVKSEADLLAQRGHRKTSYGSIEYSTGADSAGFVDCFEIWYPLEDA